MLFPSYSDLSLYHFHMLCSVNSYLSKERFQTIMTLDEVLA